MFEHFAAEPFWIEVWIFWILFINSVSLLFVGRAEGRWTLAAWLLVLATMHQLYRHFGDRRRRDALPARRPREGLSLQASPLPPRRVFAYGTLEIPELVLAVTGRRFRAEPAVLPGFARSMVRGAAYPGIAPAAGARTDGTLYRGVDDASLAALDRFEGDLYERCELPVETAAGGRCAAFVWVVRASRRDLLTGASWDRERFRAHHLAEWLARPGGPVPR